VPILTRGFSGYDYMVTVFILFYAISVYLN
jgi:hypothetical protein